MKIAMIGQKGIPAKSGGVERHVEEIAKRLVEMQQSVTVYCRSTYETDSIDDYQGINIRKIKTMDNKNLDAIVYTYRATQDAIKNKFDVIHYHAIGPGSLCFIPKYKGIKTVVTVHGLDWQRGKWGRFGRAYLKFGEYVTGRKANKIITVSENLKGYFMNKYKRDEKDIFFIPNGVNFMEAKNANIIRKFGLEENQYILFLARLVPEKGAHYLIEAYNRINTDKKLVIAGGSSYTDEYVNSLKKLAEINKNIIFTGNVGGDLLTELYSNCFLYVLPSDIEGMPITLLEAMSFGKCCLVSDIPENNGVINSNNIGETFKSGDIGDLTRKLKALICNEELVLSRGECCKGIIENIYNWNKVAESTLEVYRLLAKV